MGVLRWRKALVELAFLQMLSMCVYHVSLLSIETPRYFAFFTCFSVLPCMVYVAVMGLRLFDIDIASHLSGLNSIFHLVSHCCRLSRSSWRSATSSLLRIVRLIMLSSANKLVELCFTWSDKSFMYRTNNTGPTTLRWGTPDDMSAGNYYYLFAVCEEVFKPI